MNKNSLDIKSYNLLLDPNGKISVRDLHDIYIKINKSSNGINKFKTNLITNFNIKKISSNNITHYHGIILNNKSTDLQKLFISNNTNTMHDSNGIINDSLDNHELFELIKNEGLKMIKFQAKKYLMSKFIKKQSYNSESLGNELKLIIKKLLIINNNLAYLNSEDINTINSQLDKLDLKINIDKKHFIKPINKIRNDKSNKLIIDCSLCTKSIYYKNCKIKSDLYFTPTKTHLVCDDCI